MERARFDEYIRRFNAEDDTAFDEFIAPDMRMLNGGLEFTGVDGMKAHYDKIWAGFREELHVDRFVSDDRLLAIRMWTHFTARHDDPQSIFGPVKQGENFDFRGLILYHLTPDETFQEIQVAYNSFSHTTLDGSVIEMGIPH